jgi:acyl dehydratase
VSVSAGQQPARLAVTDAPFFEDLEVGEQFDTAPAMTLTDGHAATHQSIVGDRLALALDRRLSTAVLGIDGLMAHPSLVCDVAIGQSTVVTQRVIANLFYRGLSLRRPVMIGDTLQTVTEVLALRQNRPRPDRVATGLAVLRVRTVNQAGRAVLDFLRCAMLPLRDSSAATGHSDDLDGLRLPFEAPDLHALVSSWNLEPVRKAVSGLSFSELADGRTWTVPGGDVVSAAPELARLTLNIAIAHHDETQTGQRLVYGGHTIGISAAQATRIVPRLVSILAWQSCDHLAPVYEGDTLTGELEVERREPLSGGGGLVHLRSRVRAANRDRDVLDWRWVAVVA